MRILLVGAAGKIGRAWLRLPQFRPPDATIVAFPASETCDLTTSGGRETLREQIVREGYNLVVMAAAWTDVDRCEQEPDIAAAINVDAVASAAAECRAVEAGLIFYSSDYVFDGSGPQEESAPVKPLNVYGETKVRAEAAVRDSGAEHLIVRINVPLARAEDGSNFYSFVQSRLAAGKPVRAVVDQWNNPLDTDRIAGWSYGAWQAGMRGVLHLAGGTYATRFDTARMIAAELGYDDTQIEAIRSEALGQSAARPRRGGLITRKQAQLFGTPPDLPTILKSLR